MFRDRGPKRASGGKRGPARWGILACLLAVLIFLPSLSGGLVWEDRLNLLETSQWRGEGFTAWSLRSFTAGDYKPLVWLGYRLEAAFWGLNPVGYHLSNVFLHGLNVLLVYFLLRSLTGAAPAGVLAGALFWGIHPLRVESVAWITERKDVQFCFFYLVCLLAYLRFQKNRRWAWYWLGLVAALAALLSKAMAVSLPLLLLLLGYRHSPDQSRKKRWLEVLPFLLSAFAAGVLALVAQADSGALTGLEQLNPGERLILAGISLVFYPLKTLFPIGLEPVYGLDPSSSLFIPAGLAAWAAILAGLILLRRRGRKAARPGWAWYFLAWLPVSGLFRTGLTALADRFSYLPAIGLSWFALSLGRPSRTGRWFLAAALAGLAGLTLLQEGRWRDNLSLWGPMAADAHPVPLYNLGNEWSRRGRPLQAVSFYRAALERDCGYYSAHYNLANLLEREGDSAGAERHYRSAIVLRPGTVEARINLGNLLFRIGDTSGALEQLWSALEIEPARLSARMNLANILASLGRFEEALREYETVLCRDPGSAEAWFNLGYTLERCGRPDAAAASYERALELEPSTARARKNLELLRKSERMMPAPGNAKGSRRTPAN